MTRKSVISTIAPPERALADTALTDGFGKPSSYKALIETLKGLGRDLNPILPDRGTARLMTILPDGPATAAILLGCLDKATLVPTNPDLTVSEMIRQARTSACDAVIVMTDDKASLKKAEALDLPILKMESLPNHCASVRLSGISEPLTGGSFDDGTALILSTSGSTGTPKAVPLRLDALLASAENIAGTLELGTDDIALHMLPTFHVGAIVDLLLAPLSRGGSVHFARRGAEEVMSALAASRATWLQVVPTMLQGLLTSSQDDATDTQDTSLRFIRSVSADLAPAIHEEAERRFGVPVIQMYGMTETAGQIASMPLPPARRRAGTVGHAAGPRIAILDRSGNPLPTGREGEVCVSGPTVMRGYLGQPAGEGFFGDWFRTGDLGKLDEDGTLTLTGRLKDIINRGGEKISPVDVERALVSLSGVAEAAVIAIPHQSLGEEPHAFVVPSDGASLDADTLRRALRESLADHKIPRRIDIRDSLPRLGSGKIDRRALSSEAHVPYARSDAAPEAGSILTRRIADIWAALLNVENPVPNDDFFDLGGDSLLATSLILRVERATGRQLPPDILFDAPTLAEFAKAVRSAPMAEPSGDPMISALQLATAGWEGGRAGRYGLLLGHGLNSQKPPVFFCTQAQIDYVDLVRSLSQRRPVFVMRSLSRLNRYRFLAEYKHAPFGRLKSKKNTRRLAQHYAEDIDGIQPEGPIRVGGFCQGAVLAREIVEALTQKGREVDLFFVIDRVFSNPIDAPTLLVWSETSEHSGRCLFRRPEQHLAAMYPGGVTYRPIDVPHMGIMQGSSATRLAEEIEAAISNPPTPNGQILPDRQHAGFRLSSPRFVHVGASMTLRARVTNTSDYVWPSTDDGGPHLACRWLNLDGHIRELRSATANLVQAVDPGDSATLVLDVAYPAKKVPHVLMADMVEDGAFWFHQRGNRPGRRLIFPKLNGR